MTTIYAVLSPESKIQIKTELLSPSPVLRTPSMQVRPLRPCNSTGEPGKVRRQLAMNANKGNPVINNRRNARERNRVKQVNQGFAFLRSHLPVEHNNKKVSKVDTLRTAIEYIQGLTDLLIESERMDSPFTTSMYYSPKTDGGESPIGLLAATSSHSLAHQPLDVNSSLASFNQAIPSDELFDSSSSVTDSIAAPDNFATESVASTHIGLPLPDSNGQCSTPAALLQPPPSYTESMRELQYVREQHQMFQQKSRPPAMHHFKQQEFQVDICTSLLAGEQPTQASCEAAPVCDSASLLPDETQERDFLSTLRWWQAETSHSH